MKVSEYIKALQELQAQHGDLEVYAYKAGAVRKAPEPGVENLRILSKRESVQDYWRKTYSRCTPENKGEKVVSI